jgi:hypothetical protein
MSVVARKFSASPARLSSATWKAISAIICQSDTAAAAEFAKVAGIASCLINDRQFAKTPMVIKNDGPRLRIYCLYGDDAVDEDQKNEAALTWKPTEGSWLAFMPCHKDELADFKNQLTGRSANFFVYDAAEGLDIEEAVGEEKEVKNEASTSLAVDWEAFKKS